MQHDSSAALKRPVAMSIAEILEGINAQLADLEEQKEEYAPAAQTKKASCRYTCRFEVNEIV